MKDILNRLCRVAMAYGLKNTNVIKKLLKNRDNTFSHEFGDENFDRIREKFSSFFDNQKERAGSGQQETGQRNRKRHGFDDNTETYSDMPARFVENLALFDLTPPSSLDEVRKARNREIKKYHSDKFINDPEKLETSKEIMQIYNAAFDRLKKYYEKARDDVV
ncbi:MAG: hypothetical protein U9N60_08955 [Thermodesulfobacteriota bacterium]|nr:hypothetical protein [Thermodesulfobacteriota bacterium]